MIKKGKITPLILIQANYKFLEIIKDIETKIRNRKSSVKKSEFEVVPETDPNEQKPEEPSERVQNYINNIENNIKKLEDDEKDPNNIDHLYKSSPNDE
jgi:hypothetical protein